MTALPLLHNIQEGAAEHGDMYRWMANATAVINELQANYIATQARMADGLLAHGTLAISATADTLLSAAPGYQKGLKGTMTTPSALPAALTGTAQN